MPAKPRQHFTFDIENLLGDAVTITATAVAQVSGVDRILNVGTGRLNGNLVLDVTALDVVSNDELYRFILQGSSDSAFASGIVDLAEIQLGANEVINADADSEADRYVMPFTNVFGDTTYAYLRLRVVVSGTSPSISYGAWLAKDVY